MVKSLEDESCPMVLTTAYTKQGDLKSGGGSVRLFTTIAGLRCFLELQRSQSRVWSQPVGERGTVTTVTDSVGLVPTMGALHEGHLSLIRRARQENTCVVVSIFVNPLQFGPSEDFDRYPRTLEQDQALCQQAGVDAIFAPTVAEIYGTETHPTQVIPPVALTTGLCGASRPGHFQGVATVVTKLLSIVQPDRAYFGQKDAQQLAIIRRLVADLNLPVRILGCPIVREADGLAMSSRNKYLSPELRSQASVIYRALQAADRKFKAGERNSHFLIEEVKLELATVPEIQVEYVELVDPITMVAMEDVTQTGMVAVAARLGSTRLIDNLVLRPHRKPMIAIDGPAGAGKSTVTRRIAQALGLLYLDTGAMYRAVTWLVLQSQMDVTDEPAVAELVNHCQIELASQEDPNAPPRVWVNGQEVTDDIRSLEVTGSVSAIAAQPSVREALVKQQQRYGERGGIAIEGRDIGTFVFPDAELKIFLTASVAERAKRRLTDLKNQGRGEVNLEELEHSILERDRKDSTRALAPLRKAEDAIEILTDGLTIDEVVSKIVQLYHQQVQGN